MLVAFNLKKMKTEAEVRTEIDRLRNKIKSEKAFLKSCDELTMMEEDSIDEEIYMIGRNIKMLEWVLN